MIELKGNATIAVVMTDSLDSETQSQIITFINQDVFKGCKIVIMPDCHKGAGAVIGFTMPIKDFVIPNIVGVDIGCGIEAYKLGKLDVDFKAFDNYIREIIPCGRDIRKTKVEIKDEIKDGDFVSKLSSEIKTVGAEPKRVWHSIGTLGGGNHFIEIDVDDESNKWLVIHTGSRNFGKMVAEYYQRLAKEYISSHGIKGVIKGLEYLSVDSRDGTNYLEAMNLAQRYAEFNREVISKVLLEYFKLQPTEIIKSVHNYINFKDKIIRKGAISADKDQKLIIPFNMKDGTMVGVGKGNRDWNNSAPHGAGRRLSRTQAKAKLNVEDFKKQMKGVWTSCIGKHTLDEAPDAYKPMNEVLKNIHETVDVGLIMKPVYNFKAKE